MTTLPIGFWNSALRPVVFLGNFAPDSVAQVSVFNSLLLGHATQARRIFGISYRRRASETSSTLTSAEFSISGSSAISATTHAQDQQSATGRNVGISIFSAVISSNAYNRLTLSHANGLGNIGLALFAAYFLQNGSPSDTFALAGTSSGATTPEGTIDTVDGGILIAGFAVGANLSMVLTGVNEEYDDQPIPGGNGTQAGGMISRTAAETNRIIQATPPASSADRATVGISWL